MNSLQNQQSSSNTKTSSSSSFLSKKVSGSAMEQTISLLKKQLRQCKVERYEEKQSHKLQASKLHKQIDCLKHKIIELKQKEYLKTILNEDAEQQKIRQTSLNNNHKKLKLYAEKLQSDLKLKEEEIQRLKQEKIDLANQKQMIAREKEKHLELSIIEKINLEERIQVLEKEIQSKENLLNVIRQQGEETASKQIQLKKLERKLVKKVNEVEHYEQEMKNFKQFQTQKLQTRIQALENQNVFLKEHISRIERDYNSSNQCICLNDQCKKEIDMFKNKYINKSRELSKAKVQLSKQIFKENFMKELKNKENTYSYTEIKPRNRTPSINNTEKALITSKNYEGERNYLKTVGQVSKAWQNEDETSLNEKTLPNSCLSKYSSQLFKRKQATVFQYR